VRGWGERAGWGKRGEMTQTLYAHMNLKKNNKKLFSKVVISIYAPPTMHGSFPCSILLLTLGIARFLNFSDLFDPK
jgi:hypothetical protein